jgi:hypothetical protein
MAYCCVENTVPTYVVISLISSPYPHNTLDEPFIIVPLNEPTKESVILAIGKPPHNTVPDPVIIIPEPAPQPEITVSNILTAGNPLTNTVICDDIT